MIERGQYEADKVVKARDTFLKETGLPESTQLTIGKDTLGRYTVSPTNLTHPNWELRAYDVTSLTLM